MATFELGVDVETTVGQVSVDPDPAAPLTKGAHIFQLIVEDDDGIQSAPAQVQVVVVDNRGPAAVLSAPSKVDLGKAFRLDGSKSVDPPPGKIVKYIWTLLR